MIVFLHQNPTHPYIAEARRHLYRLRIATAALRPDEGEALATLSPTALVFPFPQAEPPVLCHEFPATPTVALYREGADNRFLLERTYDLVFPEDVSALDFARRTLTLAEERGNRPLITRVARPFSLSHFEAFATLFGFLFYFPDGEWMLLYELARAYPAPVTAERLSLLCSPPDRWLSSGAIASRISRLNARIHRVFSGYTAAVFEKGAGYRLSPPPNFENHSI